MRCFTWMLSCSACQRSDKRGWRKPSEWNQKRFQQEGVIMSQLFSVRGWKREVNVKRKEMRREERRGEEWQEPEIRGDKKEKRLVAQSSRNKGSRGQLAVLCGDRQHSWPEPHWLGSVNLVSLQFGEFFCSVFALLVNQNPRHKETRSVTNTWKVACQCFCSFSSLLCCPTETGCCRFSTHTWRLLLHYAAKLNEKRIFFLFFFLFAGITSMFSSAKLKYLILSFALSILNQSQRSWAS